MNNSTSLLEQNLSINGINSNRALSRSFKRNLVNDRLIKIPFQVKFYSKIKILIEMIGF